MKRDDDYIRELLLETEQSPKPFLLASSHLRADPDTLKRFMHAKWVADAGLFLEEKKAIYRITNQGHDYLAAIRNDTIWNKTKDSAQKAGGVTLGLMKEIAVGYAR